VTWILGACSTRGVVNRAEHLPLEDSGTVVVYRTRTSFQAGNPVPNFVYMNDEQIGRVRNGAKFKLILKPGVYNFSIKTEAFGLPTFTVARLEVNVEPGTTQYLRYSYDFAGFIIVPGHGSAHGVHSLSLVSQLQADAFK
jgi:uncharacterized protein DUF2846